ncbi:bifunctional (p)ppGpp synthetase/guanosine-3',5'-bis(diphosphate) 3'-pyrophosphohydrolase [Tumebacillus sp. ITR2]|uniref:GTP pyrophosphokinase n=1 Tax=Tumebacillus amylolyticus TaxID=2801339 RepID=A0ABS1JB15_9BACL|nr:bifunctional (p)ppGpp synthetase/guanosine-3',5'-bis(diphosphate) 3'-pyrophosphohydrolase [Tumebacillus amylolyticus]MBL0387468.1 bifunctional (p)ppGpp synthetase/guanosine-3',5'-bis(diphosphate) 3'-pyrophosphohydrolase [Tumebacillus amylolyticus]
MVEKKDPVGIERLIEKVSRYGTPDDVAMLRRAYEVAELAHRGQTRRSGEPYIMHPVAVAEILSGLELDAVTLSAALLHDVVEDCDMTSQQMAEKFGPEVAALVDGVTKLERIKFETKEEAQAENLRKMFMAMAKDIRVILIKLADRLHNMRTLKHQPTEKQVRIATETLEIYAPLAHRLGISTIKWELEDISLRYMNPQQYYRIVNLMAKKRREREDYVQEVIDAVKEKMGELDIKADLSGRAKHLYSIYRKMTNYNKQFNEIYDLLAVRIIVNNIKDCYAILGIVHTMWKPMPGRFKDYIAMPKANMYQSLHTTVVGPRGEPLEIQIRTWEMHRTAEYGIAAHWLYKEGAEKANGKDTKDKEGSASAQPGVKDASFTQKLAWFREILEWQQDFKDAQEFMETLKFDLFADEVFVFTPKGDVINLPAGSVPIDFSYRIHTDIGNRTIGAKVNGKIVPLDYKLKTGDIVEVMTSKHSYGPSQDWIKVVKSSQAKSKIRQWFKREKREENVSKGRESIEREVKKHGIDTSYMSDKNLEEIALKFNFTKIDDMMAAVGYGGFSAHQVITRLVDKIKKDAPPVDLVKLPEVKQEPKKQKKSKLGVRVKGIDNMLVRFSRCCNPVPGDDIKGFVTRGRGVSIHRNNCPNLEAVMADEENRLIEVEWDMDNTAQYNVEIEVTGLDRRGLMTEVMMSVSDTKTDITAVSARADKRKMATILLSINIRNVDHLHTVVEKIKRVKDIYAVRRIMQ